jgi:hypothetical protein
MCLETTPTLAENIIFLMRLVKTPTLAENIILLMRLVITLKDIECVWR